MVSRLRTRWALIGAVIALTIGLSGCIIGPITGPGKDSLESSFDVSKVGYQRAEYFFSETAVSYGNTAALGTDGKWAAAPDPATPAGAFSTRFLVYRPTDMSKFNGTVVVEWMNVSAGTDIPINWAVAHNEFVRAGAIYVGVTAQSVGVNAIKTANPDRYGKLSHPGDSYSYDIFTKVGQELQKAPKRFFGGAVAARYIAVGESQSAGRLVTYINAIHPLVDVYDGFMVHSRGAGSSSLRQGPLAPVPTPSPALIRNDLDVPVMVVEAEGDVIGSNTQIRQADSPLFREWEMAGTSHADQYIVITNSSDIGDGQGEIQMLNGLRNPLAVGCGLPINAGGHHWIMQAAWHHLDAWVRDHTVTPPSGPLLQVASTSPTVLSRDSHGNALGGVRSPQVDAPVATITSFNTGPGFCLLFGSTTPFTAEELAALYPTHADFVNAWKASTTANVAAGFLLPADKTLLDAAAEASTIPN
ncbi:MAG TPA: alpha/beta hydrolase domain-containing protein [Acidimicrobiia bacterium]|nr:alpha/beta hydrolase domain-containing protein [Acidimicrobiia bacterium]